jgi:hypothetical protein
VDAPPTPLEADITTLVGIPFLAYVCASDESTISRYLEHGTGLNSAQQSVLEQVLELAHQLLKQELDLRTPATQVPFSSADALSRLCIYVDSIKAGLATGLRRAAGGAVEEFATGDGLEDALLTLARDFYPTLLLPSPERDPFSRNPFPITYSRLGYEHPASGQFVSLLSDSEPLRQIFPDGPVDQMTSARQLMSRSGRGGSTQAAFLPISLLVNAEPRAWLSGEFSLATFLDAVRKELNTARLLASGSEVSVPASIGFQSVQVPGDFEIETPWGFLRAPNSWQRRWAPVNADIVLETPFPMAVEARDVAPGDTPPFPDPAFFEPQRQLEQDINQLRLSLALGSDPEAPIALTSSWRFLPDPFQFPAFSWGIDQPRLLSSTISEAQVSSLEAWMNLVDERFDGKLDLASRRLLGALTDRLHGEDGLVDAMVALESLFGTGHGEIRFRLSTALAWLLGSNAEDRAERQKAVGKLYDKRSKVVHGGHLDPAEAEEARGAATKLAIDAIKALLSERPELIPDDERGRTLVLGGSSG